MKNLVFYFACGRYVPRDNKELREFIVTKFNDITEKIIPFFEKYKIVGEKYKDFNDFCIVSQLMKNGAHLTSDGLDQICLIKQGMNKNRN